MFLNLQWTQDKLWIVAINVIYIVCFVEHPTPSLPSVWHTLIDTMHLYLELLLVHSIFCILINYNYNYNDNFTESNLFIQLY